MTAILRITKINIVIVWTVPLPKNSWYMISPEIVVCIVVYVLYWASIPPMVLIYSFAKSPFVEQWFENYVYVHNLCVFFYGFRLILIVSTFCKDRICIVVVWIWSIKAFMLVDLRWLPMVYDIANIHWTGPKWVVAIVAIHSRHIQLCWKVSTCNMTRWGDGGYAAWFLNLMMRVLHCWPNQVMTTLPNGTTLHV
jgi:hypothetical protein